MGKVFTIAVDTRTITGDAIDDLIDQLGKDCKLVYPPRPVSCPNCVPDPAGNKPGTRYVHGGPIPFANQTLCPMCGGKNTEMVQASEVVRMLVAENPAGWFVKSPANVAWPVGLIQTKGYARDLPRVLQAQQMVVQVAAEPFLRFRYKLHGEPLFPGNIVQGRHFVCRWERGG